MLEITSAKIKYETTETAYAGDRALIDKALIGCQHSFALLINKYNRKITGYIYSRYGNIQDAEDIAQDTFVRAWQNLKRYDNKYEFSTWLFTIAIRLASNHYRRQKKTVSDDDLPDIAIDYQQPDMKLQTQEQTENIWIKARQLSPLQYDILYLYYTQEMSIEQISRALDKTKISVKVNLHRGRKNLQQLMQD